MTLWNFKDLALKFESTPPQVMAGHFVNPFLKMFLESHPLCVYIMFLEHLCLHYS